MHEELWVRERLFRIRREREIARVFFRGRADEHDFSAKGVLSQSSVHHVEKRIGGVRKVCAERLSDRGAAVVTDEEVLGIDFRNFVGAANLGLGGDEAQALREIEVKHWLVVEFSQGATRDLV